MPKVRTAGASLVDALKHLRVFQARIENDQQNQVYAGKITEVTIIIQQVLIKFPLIETDVNLYSNEQLSTASILIQKEMKKNVQKIDPKIILREVFNSTNRAVAYDLAISHGLTRDQALMLMSKAPIETNLGKLIAKTKRIADKQKTAQVSQKQVVVPAGNGVIEEDDTIDSDVQMAPELLEQLGE